MNQSREETNNNEFREETTNNEFREETNNNNQDDSNYVQRQNNSLIRDGVDQESLYNLTVNDASTSVFNQQVVPQPEISSIATKFAQTLCEAESIFAPGNEEYLRQVLKREAEEMEERIKASRSQFEKKKSKTERPNCRCTRTQCLQRYCECFAKGYPCHEGCTCYPKRGFWTALKSKLDSSAEDNNTKKHKDYKCYNDPKYMDKVLLARKEAESRNPHSFKENVINDSCDNTKGEGTSGRHIKGCNCKNSKCSYKYCVCLQNEVGCSKMCRCMDCNNSFGRRREPGEIQKNIKPEANQLSQTWEAELAHDSDMQETTAIMNQNHETLRNMNRGESVLGSNSGLTPFPPSTITPPFSTNTSYGQPTMQWNDVGRASSTSLPDQNSQGFPSFPPFYTQRSYFQPTMQTNNTVRPSSTSYSDRNHQVLPLPVQPNFHSNDTPPFPPFSVTRPPPFITRQVQPTMLMNNRVRQNSAPMLPDMQVQAPQGSNGGQNNMEEANNDNNFCPFPGVPPWK